MRDKRAMAGRYQISLLQPDVAKTRGDWTPSSPFPTTERINFRGWPDAQIRCAECWFWGQKFGRIDSDITISERYVTLTNGLIDTGFSRLTADGEWVNNPGNERTSLKRKPGRNLIPPQNFLVSRPSPSSFNVIRFTLAQSTVAAGVRRR